MQRVLIAIAAAFLLAAFYVDGKTATKATLTVVNPTRNQASVDVWRYNGSYWQWVNVVARLDPGRQIPISPVNAGDRFQARLAGQPQPEPYTVMLRTGSEERWVLR